MSNPGNDNSFEQLSREAADAYTAPGNASWDKMEAALDKVMPVEKKRKRRVIFWWLFPLTIIGAGLLYTLWPSDNTKLSSTPATAKIISPAPAGAIENKKEIQQIPEDPIEDLTTEKKNTAPTQLNSGKQQNRTVNQNKSFTIQQKDISALPNKRVSDILPISNQTKKITVNQTSTTDSEATQKMSETGTKTTGTNTIPLYTIQPTADSGNTKTVTGIIEKTDTATHHPPVITDSLQKDSTITQPAKTTNSKFSIAIVAGMDASTVKYKYSDKAGINIGILAGYHFNNHWSMHTGVLFTKKNYTVAGEDFTAPKGSWVANYKLTMVDGFCDMWEVPLLLRYQFNGNKQRSFFLSAGISSYFMTRENYNYSYYWNGQPITRNSNYTEGNTHLLSILRLSGGWRKNIGAGTSLLVEPYASLPMGGVGYGSIRLSSFGLNFSLQIRQPSKKK